MPTRAALAGRGAAVMAVVGALASADLHAGPQAYEPMSAAVRTALSQRVSSASADGVTLFASVEEKVDWLDAMSARLPRRALPRLQDRVEFLLALRYEAMRAGLDPQLVLAVIDVESRFRMDAVSSAGARGLMQVMPFWARVIGDGDARPLFDLRVNLRYGCTILRHYLDTERGDLFRALGRYNGSLGRATYPQAVMRAWRRWEFEPGPAMRRAEEEVAPAGGEQRLAGAKGSSQRAPAGYGGA